MRAAAAVGAAAVRSAAARSAGRSRAAAFALRPRTRADNEARIASEQPLGANRVELTIADAGVRRADARAGLPPRRLRRRSRAPVAGDVLPARRAGRRGAFNEWYGDLIREFPSIVVAPDGGPLGFYSDWYNGGAGGPPMYETYHIDQLIPLIDARFRTTGARAGRAADRRVDGRLRRDDLRRPPPGPVRLRGQPVRRRGHATSRRRVALISAGPLAQGGQPDAIYGPAPDGRDPLARAQPDRPRGQPARRRPPGPHLRGHPHPVHRDAGRGHSRPTARSSAASSR